MGNFSISFIIPAYNAVATIWRCLDSIYNLSLAENEFEVIVIDDCSADNTVALVEDYAIRHTNLVLLRQTENHRQGAARNKGIAAARGKYTVFVDSDDETSQGVVEAVRLAEENELEMVAMRYAKNGNDGMNGEVKGLPFDSNELFTGIEMQTECPFWFTGPVAYVYRRSFLNDVNYPFAEDVFFEDSDFVNVHLFHAKHMAYCNECGYIVHYNEASTTHTVSFKHLCDYALLGTRMLLFYESLEDKASKYAEGIREGGSFNIMKAFRRLPRLGSGSEVREFYNRFDAHYDRKKLLGYREPAYCWTRWTRFGLKHRRLTIVVAGIAISLLSIRTK